KETLLQTLATRFKENMHRHQGLEWVEVHEKLKANTDKLWVLHKMEETGGEPDVVEYDEEKSAYVFYDCSKETPKHRRSVCYDREALEARKKYPHFSLHHIQQHLVLHRFPPFCEVPIIYQYSPSTFHILLPILNLRVDAYFL